MASKVCPKCGEKTTGKTSRHCRHCGASLDGGAGPDEAVEFPILDEGAVAELDKAPRETTETEAEPTPAEDATPSGAVNPETEETEADVAEGPVTSSPCKGFKLEVVAGPAVGATAVVIEGAPVFAGRAPGADLCLAKDPYASDEHAQFCLKDGAAFVVDMGSRNGTYVRIQNECELDDGAMVMVGETFVRVHREE